MNSKDLQSNGSSEADERKKKNSEAAKKCRQRKQMMAEDFKKKNEILEKENKELAKEKHDLEKKAQEYKTMILQHQEKGCKLPPEFEALWNQETDDICVNPTVSDEVRSSDTRGSANNFTSGSPPPDEPEINRSSLPITEPIALFSGTVLSLNGNITQTNRGRNNSSSLSAGSSSPEILPQRNDRPRGLSKPLTSHEIHDEAMRTSPPVSAHHRLEDSAQSLHQSMQKVHTGKDSGNHYTYNGTSELHKTVLCQPVVSSENEVVQHSQSVTYDNSYFNQDALFITDVNHDSNHNLLPLETGIMEVKNYVYSDELQQDSVQNEPVQYTNINQVEYANLNIQTNGSTSHSNDRSESGPALSIDAISPALLEIGPEMSQDLHKQIRLYSNTSSSTPKSISVSSIQGLTQQRLIIQPVSSQIQNLNIQQTWTATPSLMPHHQAPEQNMQGQLYRRQGPQQNKHSLNSMSTASGCISRQTSNTATLRGAFMSPVRVMRPFQETLALHDNSSQPIHQQHFPASYLCISPSGAETYMSEQYVLGSPCITNPVTYSMHVTVDPVATTSAAAVTASSRTDGQDSDMLETTDYSEAVQGLPSLSLTELNSESNLFDKKSSRAGH